MAIPKRYDLHTNAKINLPLEQAKTKTVLKIGSILD